MCASPKHLEAVKTPLLHRTIVQSESVNAYQTDKRMNPHAHVYLTRFSSVFGLGKDPFCGAGIQQV